ncbi:hypothetical protein K450DRAFT_249176 [Umbelopsis ramanniana AG]|uniref:Uncharacterized protein n=1 Tax=Umbelopsis ramanniana AG TaxID=1314678 RepID=A0AAD5E739_UMBRA|nr:uncharacterized protein K450DRAFT_249176 [Umbelopsis ramanniana AG]KAI8577947.1 hypothetical protein K450DRAFT_249176 [Umbelopsis ramanniana AG]
MPVPIPTSNSQHAHHTPMSWSSSHSISSSESSSSSYPEIIRELASKGPQPYGTIPPRRRKRRRKSVPFEDTAITLDPPIDPQLPPARIQRRMSHVEDWVKVDSKETLPDDDELTSVSLSLLAQLFSSSAFQGAHVLPLHVPPPNLSNPSELLQEPSLLDTLYEEDLTKAEARSYSRLAITSGNYFWDASTTFTSNPGSLLNGNHETADLAYEDDIEVDTMSICMEDATSVLPWAGAQTKAHPVLSLATATAKRQMNHSQLQGGWLHRLRSSFGPSLTYDTPRRTPPVRPNTRPLPPKRPSRRSVANSEPRIDLHSNTIRRDIRANPDHLRMIVAELNMMRARKVMCPLKPRGFLPRRKDIFVRGHGHSNLKYTGHTIQA